ncbi:PTS system glucitol/sorbitol-specific transporter subunit IIA [Lactiplantibacillus plantarum]|uniref:PTS glucitol/sorbitol transporter subunit IIA n=1 Tax=Lactiplantibacillus plantarum TaxID=1590 RepID=UPI000CF944AF|nr:PTS glucitol/sorbitol transporter subunit IIA [Lactiplantibacillus plantarum]SPE06088.1 PTS system glucitol/sorbitol-specific transporter subunit IIA [Lactiplantibacillus plantarum]SPE11343.1 PTS system glucitol/sorbitol-specific transporter subunit IIA [Lactiplantibacillus plantarum]SPH06356.1 PTS system glucitol/sorbitol-specific transporter subunit IIA [Lactiplantibacillus plantarum]SPH09505.1 PTS system glucitol/sorbitol-specific transporter subunit IIA [Lactiplantibacillus plantarum]
MMTKERIIFSTKVLEIGAESADFKSIGMAVLFGDEAPDALRPSCFIIEVVPISEQITAGMKLEVDNQVYQITAVGGEVQTNLRRLGHTAISFTGAKEAKLPGTLYVEQGDYPDFKVGSVVRIIAE